MKITTSALALFLTASALSPGSVHGGENVTAVVVLPGGNTSSTTNSTMGEGKIMETNETRRLSLTRSVVPSALGHPWPWDSPQKRRLLSGSRNLEKKKKKNTSKSGSKGYGKPYPW